MRIRGHFQGDAVSRPLVGVSALVVILLLNVSEVSAQRATTRPVGKIKVGFVIGVQQNTGPKNPPELFGWLSAQFAKKFVKEPSIEVYGLFEEAVRDVAPAAVREMF